MIRHTVKEVPVSPFERALLVRCRAEGVVLRDRCHCGEPLRDKTQLECGFCREERREGRR